MRGQDIALPILLIFLSCFNRLNAITSRPRVRHVLSEDILPPVSHQQLRVAIVNGVGFHTEVYTALLWSFQSTGAETSAFVKLDSTAGIENVIRIWYKTPFQAYETFLEQACTFDIVVFATFPEHHLALAGQTAEQRCSNQRMVGVVHNPQELHLPGVKMILQSVGMHVLALAPHTVEECTRALHQGDLNASVQLFVPVFPVHLEAPACKDEQCWESGNATQNSFVLQGLFQPHRRNYAGLFESILLHEGLMQHKDFVLHLIGRGEVVIPAGLHGKVVKEPDLAYPEYYRTVQDALAVLPAFASNVYYTSKASSSVATAITCGTPLLADEELLAAYSYLPDDTAFLKESHEDDAAGMARILGMPAEQLLAKRAAIVTLLEDLYYQNGIVVESVIEAFHHARNSMADGPEADLQ